MPALGRTAASNIAPWRLALAGCLAAVLGAKILLIARLGIPTPYWDQWDAEAAGLYLPWLEGRLDAAHWFAFHNEHRLVLTRAFLVGVGQRVAQAGAGGIGMAVQDQDVARHGACMPVRQAARLDSDHPHRDLEVVDAVRFRRRQDFHACFLTHAIRERRRRHSQHRLRGAGSGRSRR